MDPVDPAYPQLLQAVAFAARAHRSQLRKDGETPYVSHVFRVCLVVRDIFGFDDRQMLLAALLHDTMEDTTTDFDDVEEKFGRQVAEWAACLSKDKRLPEQEREKAYMEQLSKAPWQVRACKLADMFDNLMDLHTSPRERRTHTLERMESYLKCLKNSPSDKHLERPLAVVEQLLNEVRGS